VLGRLQAAQQLVEIARRPHLVVDRLALRDPAEEVRHVQGQLEHEDRADRASDLGLEALERRMAADRHRPFAVVGIHLDAGIVEDEPDGPGQAHLGQSGKPGLAAGPDEVVQGEPVHGQVPLVEQAAARELHVGDTLRGRPREVKP
jgi:hypothetical protein